MKIISLRQSDRKNKKWEVIVEDGEKFHTIHFGDTRYEDYTQHGDAERRERYLNRHKSREDWENPLTAGFWSRWLLWGNSRDLMTNLRFVKRNFF